MGGLKKHIRENYRLLLAGIAFIIFAVVSAPALMQFEHFSLMELVIRSIDTGSVVTLIKAALLLTVLSTLRSLPIFLGPLLLSEGVGTFEHGCPWWVRWSIILLIPCIFESIYLLHDITYDFGVPALTMILAILIMSKMRNLARSIVHKAVVLLLLLFGVQWLDIVPLLSPYHFGRGSLADLIKTTAYLNYASDTFNVMGLSLCVICVANAFLLARILNLYTIEIQSVEQKLALEKLNHQMEIQVLENRSLREMRALVHDLKTPLTSIQGLAGVISISRDPDLRKQHADYISGLVDKMSGMVDELLNEDSRQVIRAEELARYAVAHIPQLNDASTGKFELRILANPLVKVNKIRLSRALINVLQNACEAVDPASGAIDLTVDRAAEGVAFIITDNGQGFTGNINDIWKIGYSQKHSSGLGMAFVRDMVQKYGGAVKAENNPGGGARVTIILPALPEPENGGARA
ncbi:MAG: HAMP domain-containing histidine kinase [Acidaminococcaceae bacterium]|nr:HAMP domain-containing histidine kinase [Acidaminococcaceae bacterium]